LENSGNTAERKGVALISVLPRRRNFGRKTQKGPKNIVWGRENLEPNFFASGRIFFIDDLAEKSGVGSTA
jgi:hypothetical protein